MQRRGRERRASRDTRGGPCRRIVDAGSTHPLIVRAFASDGSEVADRAVTWVSSNPAVASVVAPGRVTAHAPGTATITATNDGTLGQATVIVAEWIARPLLALNDSALPATLHVIFQDANDRVLTGLRTTNGRFAITGRLEIVPGVVTPEIRFEYAGPWRGKQRLTSVLAAP